MKAVIVHTRNPINPLQDRRTIQLRRRLTISHAIQRHKIEIDRYPTICLVNGEPVLRRDWKRRKIRNGDIVAFVSVLQGGRGGSNPFMILGMIVLAVVAWYAAPYLGSALAGTGLVTEATGLAIAQAGIMLAGGALLNAAMPTPNPPSALRQAELSAPSPTYGLQAQGNTARLGQPIPVIYGEHRVYPDFAAEPYNEFEGNEQYLYQLFCIGQGEYTFLDARIEDSDISAFQEVQYWVYGPNQQVTAFPTNVISVSEVGGQELVHGQYLGGFVINEPGTQINQIAVDIATPRGLYYANDEGGLDPLNVQVQIDVSKWDGGGWGPWMGLVSPSISAASNTPIYRTYKISVDPGAYQIRATRTNAKDTRARAAHDVNWYGARGYMVGNQNYGDVTVVAVKAKASNNLSQQSRRRFNFKVRRKLKTWHPVNGWSATATDSRSIAWALADICRADYGGKLPESQYDLQALYDIDQTLIARNATFGPDGDFFDGVFDQRVTFWEALTIIARCGRVLPYMQGGLVRFVRDQAQSIPTALFSMRNIVQGTFNIEYVMASEQTADSVIVEYFDRDTLKPKEVTATLPGGTADKPARLRLFGATSGAHAWREGITMAAANRYRRKIITFQTELEGHIPAVLDLIAVCHDMPTWGTSGEIEAVDGVVLTLSQPVTFQEGQTHYIGLRKRNGSVGGPYRVIPVPPGDDPYKVQLDAGVTLDFTPDTGTDREKSYFAFGPAGQLYQLCRVLAPIRARGENKIEITAVNEDGNVHLVDGGVVPSLPSNPFQTPRKVTRPTIQYLSVAQGGTSEAPILYLSWSPAPDADHYVIEYSTDNQNWSRVGDTFATSYSFAAEPGPAYLRVAAVGLAIGPWIDWEGTLGEVPPPGIPQNLAAAETFTGTRARIKWDPVKRATSYVVEVTAAGEVRRTATTTVPFFEYSAEDVKKDGGPWRTLEFTVAASNDYGTSDPSAPLILSNPAPGALTGVTVYAGVKSVVITYDRPNDLDFEGILVCMDTTQGFTPQPGVNEVYRGGDRTIVIPNLTEDVTYYFRLAAYDTFGIDGLDFGATEHQATITSLNLPTPQEVLDAVQTALDDPETDNKVVFDADAFLVRLPSVEDVIPFAIVDIEGQPTVAMQANVYVLGHISANQLRSGEIAADQRITLNNGRIALDGQGAIFVYDTGPDPNNPDFAVLTDGDLSFQRYRNGVYYEHKSVKRVETGQAMSGQTVTLPGYWDAQPKIMVSPYSLQCYNKTAANQDQTLSFAPSNIREDPLGSGIWKFDAVANLTIASNVGSTGVNQSVYQPNNDAWNSGQITLFNNTSQITVRVRFRSRKGVGTDSNYYYYRAVTWRVYGRVAANPTQWDQLSVKTRSIAAAEHDATLSDSVNIAISPAGKYDRIYVAFTAGNSGGGYYIGAGGGQYEYGVDNTAVNVEERPTSIIGDPSPRIDPLHGYSLPIGWQWHSVVYVYDWRAYNAGVGSNGYVYFPHGTVFVSTGSSTPWSTVAIGPEGGSFNINRISVSKSTTWVFGATRNRYAQITRKRLLVSDANAYNNFYVDTVDWTLAGGTALAQGGLNWMAIGE